MYSILFANTNHGVTKFEVKGMVLRYKLQYGVSQENYVAFP